jgi:predicted phage terminase large subunit-like protein
VSSVSRNIDPKVLARSSPAGFAWYASGGSWIPAPHLQLLSKAIINAIMGRAKPRLMVYMPPRHGKSELISRYTPAWFLGRFPDRKVMLASYADTFAAQWGRRARDTLEDVGPRLFNVRVSQEAKGGAQWELAHPHEGIMVTAGVGGGLTGKGAHLLVIDDPVKNADEAHSERVRESHHDWWKSTARTRLQKGGVVVLVMTRWHEDDLAGRLLLDEMDDGDQWDILCLPGFAEEAPVATYPGGRRVLGGDALGRPVGEPLWPDMFDAEALERTRKAMGNYWFSAMYQQRPTPAEGQLFKRKNFRYFTVEPDHHETGLATIHRDSGPEIYDYKGHSVKFCTVDVAASEKQQADYTVVATWLVTEQRDLLLWDLERQQFEGPEVKLLIRRIYFEQRPAFVAIERLGHGLGVIQELVREGLPITRLEADKDKLARALPAVARFEEHRVFFRRDAHYLEALEQELLAFPNAKNDDQVDVVAYAARQLPTAPAGIGVSYTQRQRGDTITGGMLTQQF